MKREICVYDLYDMYLSSDLKPSIKRFLSKPYFSDYCLNVVGSIYLSKFNTYHIKKAYNYFNALSLRKYLMNGLIKILSDLMEFGVELGYFPTNFVKEVNAPEYVDYYHFDRLTLETVRRVSVRNLRNKNLKEYSTAMFKALGGIIEENESVNSFKTIFDMYVNEDFSIGKKSIDGHVTMFYNFAYPCIGNKDIRDVSIKDIEKLIYIIRLKNIAYNCIYFFYRNLKRFFSYAYENGLLEREMTFDSIHISGKNNDRKPLSEEELKKISEIIKGCEFEPVIGLLMTYGLRIGEVLGIRMSSIDFKNRILTIESQITEGRFVGSTKTGSIRKVRISKSAEYYINLAIQKDGCNKRNRNELLFKTIDGKPLPTTSIRNFLREIGNKIGRHDIVFHTFRHTYVTISSEHNASLVKTKELVGHESVLTTMKTYIHKTEKSYELSSMKTLEYFRRILDETS